MHNYSTSTLKNPLETPWSGAGKSKLWLVVAPWESIPEATLCSKLMRSVDPVMRYLHPGDESHVSVAEFDSGENEDVSILRSFLRIVRTLVLKFV